jgi:hypothetical protein
VENSLYLIEERFSFISLKPIIVLLLISSLRRRPQQVATAKRGNQTIDFRASQSPQK